MNIKDFLMDNFVYIIIIIILIIVTIIGFLADKKKNGEKKEAPVPGPTGPMAMPMGITSQPAIPAAPMTYQPQPAEPVNNQMGMQAMPGPMPAPEQPVNNMAPMPEMQPNFGPMNQMTYPQPVPTPVENMAPAQPIEQPQPMPMPAYEQVPNFSSPMPQPINPVPISQPQMEQVNIMPNNGMIANQYPQPAAPNMGMVNPIPSVPEPAPMPGPIPTPVEPVPMPEPMAYPQPSPTAQPVNPQVPNQPMNFVFGPQANNQNNNMM